MSISQGAVAGHFRIFSSNRLEVLLSHLVDIVSVPLHHPFDKEVILVQSKGMERWLIQRLAEKCGIWANASFPFPNALVRQIFNALLGEMPEYSSFSPETMAWRIMRLLPARLDQPGFESVRNYLAGEQHDLKTLQFCQKLADAFDQYTIYRPAMVREWEQGKENHWQAQLWSLLVADCAEPHRAALQQQAIEMLGRGEVDVSLLPSRISIIGIPVLPPFHLEVLEALSGFVEVNLLLMNPCKHYWGDLVSKTQLLRDQSKSRAKGRDPSESHREVGNPLLASTGRLGGEFLNLLIDRDIWDGQGDFIDPGESSLLTCLQSDILNLRNRGHDGRRSPLHPQDASIQVHSVHSPMREMEILNDYLLSLFDKNKDLAPHDILVMTPQIETYAPFISAVFSAPEDPRKRIPFSIADRSPRSESLVIQAFLTILHLFNSRFGATEVLDLLDSPVVCRRFGLASGDIALIRRWIEETGIRWGRDGDDRSRFGVPPFEENSWQEGIKRLLLGYALPLEKNQFFSGVLPYDDVEGNSSQVLGCFADFAASLFAQVRDLEHPRTLTDWNSALQGLLDHFIMADEENEREVQIIRDQLNQLAAIAGSAGFAESVGLESIRYWLEAKLQGEAHAQGFLSTGVTFCEMLPMRSIPFRVLALVGMNNGAFPRQGRPPEFDLIAQSPRPCDRSLRDEDRYLFLEALLSARERLYISYVGQSIKDNSEIPPSPLVSEMLDYIEQGFQAAVPAKMALDQVVIRHRLQAFSPAYFERDGKFFSYSRENLDALRTRVAQVQDPAPFLASPIPAPSDDWKRLDIRELKRFFRQPAEYFLRNRLGIRLEEAADAPENREPFALDELQRYSLKQELVKEHLRGEDPAGMYAVVRSWGILPPGTAGEILYRQAASEAARFADRVKSFLISKPTPPLELELAVGGSILTGTINDIWPEYLLRYRCATVKPKDQIGAWIEHLALNCVDSKGHPRRSLLIGSDNAYRFVAVEGCRAQLEQLLILYREGLTRPIPFFPESSFAYAEKIDDPDQAIKAARKAWYRAEKTWKQGRVDEDDPYNSLAFRRDDPLSGRFIELAEIILAPLLQCRQAL